MEIKITSTVREMSKITGFNLREEIGKGRAMPLELVLFSYIKNTSQIIVAPEPGKTFNKQEYDEVKKTDPEKASQMLPNILIYGGGIPPQKRMYVKFDTFLPGSRPGVNIVNLFRDVVKKVKVCFILLIQFKHKRSVIIAKGR